MLIKTSTDKQHLQWLQGELAVIFAGWKTTLKDLGDTVELRLDDPSDKEVNLGMKRLAYGSETRAGRDAITEAKIAAMESSRIHIFRKRPMTPRIWEKRAEEFWKAIQDLESNE